MKSFFSGVASLEFVPPARGRSLSCSAFAKRAVSDEAIRFKNMSEQTVIPKAILNKEVDEAVKRRTGDKPLDLPYLSDYEPPEYSLGNAIRGQINGRLDGYEAEVHQELNR